MFMSECKSGQMLTQMCRTERRQKKRFADQVRIHGWTVLEDRMSSLRISGGTFCVYHSSHVEKIFCERVTGMKHTSKVFLVDSLFREEGWLQSLRSVYSMNLNVQHWVDIVALTIDDQSNLGSDRRARKSTFCIIKLRARHSMTKLFIVKKTQFVLFLFAVGWLIHTSSFHCRLHERAKVECWRVIHR